VTAPNTDEPELALEEGEGVPNREEAELPDEPNNGEGELGPTGDGLAAGWTIPEGDDPPDAANEGEPKSVGAEAAGV